LPSRRSITPSMALPTSIMPSRALPMMATPGPVAMNQFMYRKMPFDTANAFAAISYIASVPSVLVISPKIDARSVADFVAQMKARPDGANFGSAGMGSTGHLGGTLFSASTGVTAQHVPYRGSAPMLQDLISGNLQFTIDTVPGVMSFITSGTLQALAVTSKLHSPSLLQVPNNVEAGIPDVEMSSWLALLAPAGTQRAVIDRVNAAVNAAIEEPELRQKMLDLGAVPVGGTPEDLAVFLHAEVEKWKKVIALAGVKIE
jgi:tripartite-type tricarboxylate transporter receptor subunit TctC